MTKVRQEMDAPEAEGLFRRSSRRKSSSKINTLLTYTHTHLQTATGAVAALMSIRHVRTKTMIVLALCALVILFNTKLLSDMRNSNTVAVKPVVGSKEENIGGIRVQKENDDAVKGEEIYSHDNKKLVDVVECTNDQLQSISGQLRLEGNVAIGRKTRCPNPTWITNFYKEEKDIGSSSFLGVNIGCNKGHDAINVARMGMSNAEFDVNEWINAAGFDGFVCGSGDQPEIVFPSRQGEMHCIEPIAGTFTRLANASSVLGYDKKGFVVTQAVVSSRDGEMEFSGMNGQENLGIHDQRACQNPSDCKKVPMYSTDSYFDKFVQSKGPVNMLLIDVEGWDFDVLFGASSVLDRTQYLEFEYHMNGPWGRYHLPDSVRLLDHKGFTCYWSGNSKLWRITGCYFDVYNAWHGWSNVACVHRTYDKLAERMESLFLATMKEDG